MRLSVLWFIGSTSFKQEPFVAVTDWQFKSPLTSTTPSFSEHTQLQTAPITVDFTAKEDLPEFPFPRRGEKITNTDKTESNHLLTQGAPVWEIQGIVYLMVCFASIGGKS